MITAEPVLVETPKTTPRSFTAGSVTRRRRRRSRCGRRGRNPIEIVLLRFAWRARTALRAHLAHPQLSQQLVKLRSELARQVGTRVLMHHGAQVDEQPGISPSQFNLGGIDQAEQDIGDELLDGKRPHLPHMLADVFRRSCTLAPGVTVRVHDSQPPGSPAWR